MTTTANGGKVWTPGTMDNGTKIVLVFLAVVPLMGIPFGIIDYIKNTTRGPVETIQRTNGLLILEYIPTQRDEALTEVKDWIPESLGVDAANVSEINLDRVENGTTGNLQLSDGSSIPFTLHNYHDSTFTIEEG